jgi:hypothetical protein
MDFLLKTCLRIQYLQKVLQTFLKTGNTRVCSEESDFKFIKMAICPKLGVTVYCYGSSRWWNGNQSSTWIICANKLGETGTTIGATKELPFEHWSKK